MTVPRRKEEWLLLSIAICTHNRAEQLRRCLNALSEAAEKAELDWELIVVNNACTDHTADVCRSFAGTLPIRMVMEPEAGLSNARNRAVSEATGEFLVWTDDDVLVDHSWLLAYQEAFLRHPEGSFFGGPVAPLLEGNTPKWLEAVFPQIENVYAARDFGEDIVPLSRNRLPFGANFAVRLQDQRQYPFNPDLGLAPGRSIGHEEVSVLLQMLSDGLTGWWVPRAGVKHIIPVDRQSVRYVREYFRGQGQVIAKEELLAERTIFGAPGWLWREAIKGECKYLVSRVFCHPTTWIKHLRKSSMSWGQIRERRRRLESSRRYGSATLPLT